MKSLQRAAAILAWVALVVALPGPVGADEETAGQETQGLRVEQDNLDLGSVVSGTTAVAVFTFHNQSQRDIKIIRAKPS